VVVSEGHVTAELDRDEATPESVMHAATSGHRSSEEVPA
jgi:rhamnose transport system ATP-binding protein